MSELKQVVKELNFQQNYVGNMFLKPPKNEFSRVNIFGEISCLSEFTAESLYLFYEFYLPYGWKIDNENDYSLIYKEMNYKNENHNRLKSISQISTGYVNDKAFSFSKGENYSYNRGIEFKNLDSLIHNFSLPFDVELLGHNLILDSMQPKMLIQVNSVDSWGRHRIEGYTFVNVPIKTGSFSLDVACYKPEEDHAMKIFSYFLGGSRKIPDLKELAKAASGNDMNFQTVLNRYGIHTQYSGTVHLNFNVTIQEKSIMNKARSEVKNRQPIEDYNLIFGINKALGEEVAFINEMKPPVNIMKTTGHDSIPRTGGGQANI